MSNSTSWLAAFSSQGSQSSIDGIVPVKDYCKANCAPEEVAIMERAQHYKADAVFFEASRDGKPSIAQAFLYRAEDSANTDEFAELHHKLWSWGGVPLLYRVSSGRVELFRCAHRPDFENSGKIVFKPFKTLNLASKIATDPWWDAERLRSGTLWDDPGVCKQLISSNLAAQKTLIKEVKRVHQEINEHSNLPKKLQRRLLILSVLIAYLEKRGVFEDGFFSDFLPEADNFFQVLANGPALVDLLKHLEDRFNGHVFTLEDQDRTTLRNTPYLSHYAQLIEGRQESNGQLTLWQRYSFADLPVELISHIYQLFVKDTDVSVYTPHFLVRLMLGEVLSWERLDRLKEKGEVILDPACGSGIFLVEAYKRLVLHWRSRNGWERPGPAVLQELLRNRIRGIDLEEGAVELAAFSLCLALCDALEPMEIRASVKLFTPLMETALHTGCFFKKCEEEVIKEPIGVIVGNPPFASSLSTDSAEMAYQRYQSNFRPLPDKQIAYLFLHQSMELLAQGGVLSMLQQYNFLYNQQSVQFRKNFIEQWDVREILDFVSVRGLFQKGDADTKVIIVVAEARHAPPSRQILHATFRRSGRATAEQGFSIDYYDMHWLPRELVLSNDRVWRCDLLGGGRVLGFVERLSKLPTLGRFAVDRGWENGEGFIVGKSGRRLPAQHLTGKAFLPSEAITGNGIDTTQLDYVKDNLFKTAYSEKRFSPPMLLIREHMDIDCATWFSNYLTYKNKVVGINGTNESDAPLLKKIETWIKKELTPLRAYAAATSVRLFTQKATTLSEIDILSLPLPENWSLQLSADEQIIVDDIVYYYRDIVRLGEKSSAMEKNGTDNLDSFNEVFTSRLNGVYKQNKLRALEPQSWPGVVCQPFIFGDGILDWTGAEQLKGKLDTLLREKLGGGLNITRIARIYDGACIYLIKPDRLRFWLRSVALRDADETLADLVAQGF